MITILLFSALKSCNHHFLCIVSLRTTVLMAKVNVEQHFFFFLYIVGLDCLDNKIMLRMTLHFRTMVLVPSHFIHALLSSVTIIFLPMFSTTAIINKEGIYMVFSLLLVLTALRHKLNKNERPCNNLYAEYQCKHSWHFPIFPQGRVRRYLHSK